MLPLEPKQLLLVAEVPGRGGGDGAERKGAQGKNTKKNAKKQNKNKKTGEENSRKYRQQCLQHTRESPGATREKDAHQHNNNNKNAWYTAVVVVTSTCIVTETQHAVGSKQVSSRTGSRRRPGGSGRPLQHLDTTRERQTDRQRGKAPVNWLSHLSVYSQK